MLHKSNRQLFNLNIKTTKKDAARKGIQFSHPALRIVKCGVQNSSIVQARMLGIGYNLQVTQ